MKEIINFNLKKIKDEEVKQGEISKSLHVPEDIGIEVIDSQREKQDLVNLMHEKFKLIDEGQEIVFDRDSISVDINKDGKIFAYGKKGVEIPLTNGDIARGSLWGLNFKMSANFDRKTKKEFVLREIKRKIASLYDKQLAVIGANTSVNKNTGLDNAYEAILERSESKLDEKKAGVLAEKVIESFFTKLNINHTELPFSFESVDVFEDVENKIDFIFKVKTHNRGVKVELGKDAKIGIQFTINPNAENKKMRQIKRVKRDNNLEVDDLVLVTLPMEKINHIVETWRNSTKNEKILKMPDDYLPIDINKFI